MERRQSGGNDQSFSNITLQWGSFSNQDENPSGISSKIHDEARVFNWGKVTELCQTEPEAAAYVGKDGWTALHHACNRRCPDIDMMRDLINAYPDALLLAEKKKGDDTTPPSLSTQSSEGGRPITFVFAPRKRSRCCIETRSNGSFTALLCCPIRRT